MTTRNQPLEFQPLVFVSSSIASMRDLRRETKEAIEATGLADTWLWEFHASASGDPPSAQYLGKARSCDIFVLVVADGISPATWAEYEEAYGDNPSKIIPILVGEPTRETEAQQKLLGERHSYGPRRLSSIAEVAESAKAAVEHAIRSGAILLSPLREIARDQLAQRRRLLALPEAFEFPSLVVMDSSAPPRHLADVLESRPQVIVQGPAGAGKSYIGLRHLVDAAPAGPLPIYLPITRAHNRHLFDLIADAISGARFRADTALLTTWAVEGRLCLVIDGLDQISDESRDQVVDEIDAFGRAHPRCQIVVLARSIAQSTLIGFGRVEAASIPEDSLLELFRLAGREIQGVWDLPTRLRDFARRPLWAGLLATTGLQVRSALGLLQRFISDHLSSAAPNSPVEAAAIHSALLQVALLDQTRSDPAVELCVDRLASWSTLATTAAKYEARSAEWYLEQIVKSGLASIAADRVELAHPLLSACLAAEAFAVGEALPHDQLSRDARIFAAALLPEHRADEVVDLLAELDVFGLASVARVQPPLDRRRPLEEDLIRYNRALLLLRDKSGQATNQELRGTNTAAMRCGGTMALRPDTLETPEIQEGCDLTDWAHPESEAKRYAVWTPQPFDTTPPEIVAGQEIVARLKDRVLALRPEGSWHPSLDADTSGLVRGPGLDAALTAFVKAVQAHRRVLLTELNLRTHPALSQELDGEPTIVVQTVGGREPSYRVSWGTSDSGAVTYLPEASEDHFYGESLRAILADPAAYAWHALSQQLERELGSALETQDVTGVSAFPEWAL